MAIDAWIFFNLVPDVAHICDAGQGMARQERLEDYFNVDNVPHELILTMCIYKFQFARLNLYMLNHF